MSNCPKCKQDTVVSVLLHTQTSYKAKKKQEASRQTEINNSNISQVCKNKRTTAGGFKWELV